jgi:hypothetical protein
MAARLEMTEEAFTLRCVRTVRDPRTGQLRESLREEGGRCALLEGANTCSVYEARPQHCRTFPYWPSVFEDAEGFERARETCPGIAVEVDPKTRAAAFVALEELYKEVDAFVARSGAVCELSGLCCRFEDAGHELFSTGLEADYAASEKPEAPAPEGPGRCPYHVGGRCTAREGRALGCRTYFCDTRTTETLEAAHERFLGRVRAIEREHGYPVSYGRFPALLSARGVGEDVEERA